MLSTLPGIQTRKIEEEGCVGSMVSNPPLFFFHKEEKNALASFFCKTTLPKVPLNLFFLVGGHEAGHLSDHHRQFPMIWN